MVGDSIAAYPNIRRPNNLKLTVRMGLALRRFGNPGRTHLRFFTEKSIALLFNDIGFHASSLIGINEDWWHEEKRLKTKKIAFQMVSRIHSRQEINSIP